MSVIPSITLTAWLRYAACFTAVVAMTITSGSLQAAFCDTGANSTNLIGNCGFENSTSLLTSWTTIGSALPSNATSPPQAPNGNTQNALLSVTIGAASITQNIVGLVAGTTYNVQFQYLTESLAGASFSIRDSLNANVIAPTTLSPSGATTWGLNTYQFTATSSNIPYKINFSITGSSTASLRVDNVIVAAVPVPEPASMLLLGSLCSAVVGYKYKRKNSA